MGRGWIWAPDETEESFLARKKLFEQSALPKEKGLSVLLYDLQDMEAFVIHSNESLLPWQGAVLWEYSTEDGKKYPVVQLRKSSSKIYSKMYKKEELLAHELVHAARFAFKEPIFEEVFAYQTSQSLLRRFLGPLFMFPFEAGLFAFICLITPLITLLGSFFGGLWLIFSAASFFVGRLLLIQALFFLCQRKLEKIGLQGSDVLPVMVRLSDREIIKIALYSKEKAAHSFRSQEEKQPHLKKIIKTYFNEVFLAKR